MRKYHLLPANLEYFNMNNLRDELQKNKYLKWFNSKSSGCKIHSYEKGDIVYIYYKNLTDGSNRILFRGEVLDPDFIVDNVYYEIKSYIDDRVQSKCRDFPSDKTLIILDQNKMQKYLSYCEDTYGKNFAELYDRSSPSWMDLI